MTSELDIALIRHGKTASNMRGAFTGKRDESLCECAASELEGRIYPEVETLFTSPMRRCVETARLVYPDMEPIVAEDLCERNFGDFEGKTHEDIIRIPGYSDWGMNAQSMVFPGGEDYELFLKRCVNAFNGVLAQVLNVGAKSTAIVCHGGVIMAILSEIAEPRREYFSWMCKNGGGYILKYGGDTGGVAVKGSIFE